MQSQEKTPFVVGVTGGIGSGKSAVTDFLARQGVSIVDADIAARTVVEPNQPALREIEKRFGLDILLGNGGLNRKKLRAIIFNDGNEKEWLEKLLHPKINQLLRQQLSEATSPYIVLVSPLLAETAQHTMVDSILVVDASEATQLKRSMERDGMSAEQAQCIINSQIPRKQRLKLADDIVNNDGTLEQLHDALTSLHRHYLQRSDNKKAH